MRCVAIAALFCASCVQPDTVTCADGSRCPANTVCAPITDPDQMLCVSPGQLADCTGKPRFTHCGSDSRCYDGVCLPVACGNGRVDGPDPNEPGDIGEVCDDGNQISGDGCSANCQSDETCGNGVVDPVKGELCDDGNHLQHDGCDSRCQLEQPIWTSVPPAGPGPLNGIAIAFDLKRARAVMFGGVAPTTGEVQGATWELRSGWVAVPTVLAPSPRANYGIAYDAPRSRVVLFGGDGPTGQDDDTWEWDGAAWIPHITVMGPSARTRPAMVYEQRRKRTLLYGGVFSAGVAAPQDALQDMWEWDGTVWTQLAATNPPGLRAGAAIAYDPERDVVVLFGGDRTNTETWEYGPDKVTNEYSWRLVATTGPGPRENARMVYDPGEHLMLMFGGIDANKNLLQEMWAWNGGAWTPADAAGEPSGRSDFGMVSDPLTHRTTVYGGVVSAAGADRDIYTLTSGGVGSPWEATEQTCPLPDFASGAYDSAHQTEILVDKVGNTWTLADGDWFLVDASGTAVATPMMAFDPARVQTVRLDPVKGYTYAWDGTQWVQLVTVSPPPRLDGVLGWDAANQRLLLFGGVTSTGAIADTWSWDGSVWTELSPAHSPAARSGAVVLSDPIRQQLVLFGGVDGAGSALGDTWVWNGIDWIKHIPAQAPPARSGAAMAWNAARQRVTLFGGIGANRYHDLWEWDGSSWTLVQLPNPPPPRSNAIMFPSVDGTALNVFGGLLGQVNLIFADQWQVRWSGTSPDDNCYDPADDSDGDGLTGCKDPDCWWACEPACPPGAACDPAAPHCGDGTCSKFGENCRNCPADCECTPVCGDSYCDPGEDAASCPGDCP